MIYVAIILLALGTHAFVVPAGMGFLTTEHAGFALFSDWIREGHLSVFAFRQDYVGIAENILRALWCFLWMHIDHSRHAYMRSHMFFNYGFMPSLMAVSSYYLAKGYCSEVAARVVGLMAAVGFHFWVSLYGHSFYGVHFALICILLHIKAKNLNPLVNLDAKHLLFCATIMGYLFYLNRSSAIYLFVFLIPWPWLMKQFELLMERPRDLLLRILKNLGFAFLCFFFYIEIFGRNLGTASSHTIKVDSRLNLQIALILFALVLLKRQWTQLTPPLIQRGALACAGFVLGFLPEIYYSLSNGNLQTKTLTMGTNDWFEMLQFVSKIPGVIKDLVSNGEYMTLPYSLGNALSQVRPLSQNFSILFFIIASILFLKSLKRRPELKHMAFAAALCFLFYVRLRSSVVPPGPARYLYTLFPVLIVMVGVAIDELKGSRWRPLFFVLMGLHCGHQLYIRSEVVNAIMASGCIDEMTKVVEIFRNAKVPVVISTDFIRSNQYTFLSHSTPAFWSTGRPWGPPWAYSMAHHESRVGIFARIGEYPEIPGSIVETNMAEFLNEASLDYVIKQRRWKIAPVGHVGEHALFIAEQVN